MPLGPGIRYRVSTKGGRKVRLAFRGNEVVEAKNLDSGEVHTESEFKRDAKRKIRSAEEGRKARKRMRRS